MSLLTLGASVIGAIKGNKADKAKNKRASQQMRDEKDYARQQIDLSRYIADYAKQAGNMNGEINDIYGGRTWFNPVTGKYETTLGAEQRGIQAQSDIEEADRYGLDQSIRRAGLTDFETMRDRSAGEATTALDDIRNFKRGVGTLDAGRVGSQLRADRTGAINAGYDDAERAAQTMQLRTGSSAVGDALTALARDRVRAQSAIGSPELEGIEFAEGVNQNRENNLMQRYGTFGNEGRQFYDAAFSPAGYNTEALGRLGDLQKFDLSKLDLAMGGYGQAAGTIGNAATGQRAGFAGTEANRIHAPGAKLWQGIGAVIGAEEAKIAKMFGMGG